jgi:hypothetical protein
VSISFCLLLAILLPITSSGHGRNPSIIEVNLTEIGASVNMKLAVVDLLEARYPDADPGQYPDPVSNFERMEEQARKVADSFTIFLEGASLPETPLSQQVVDRIFPNADHHGDGADQRYVEVVARYRFDNPPARLTFLHDFGGNGCNETISANLLVRMHGELILLPSPIGPVFPVMIPLDWSADRPSLARASNLEPFRCDWRSRPATAFLEFTELETSWKVFFPLRTLFEELENQPLSVDCDFSGHEWDHLREFLVDSISLRSDGVEASSDNLRVRVRPMDEHRFSEGETLTPDGSLSGLVELSLSTSTRPGLTEASWKLYKETIPVVFTRVSSELVTDSWVVLDQSRQSVSLQYEE